MSVNLSPVAGAAAQFLDNSGNVLTGGKLYTYLAGTTTPAATYTSSIGTTFHANPIILDAAGRVPSGGEIWLADAISYKFVLKNANDVLIATWDNLSGINSNFLDFEIEEEIQIATAGQTVFNLTSITYTPGGNNLQVFVDGINQYDGTTYNYTQTNANTVTFLSGLPAGSDVKFTTATPISTNTVNANQVVYTPAGTGAVITNVQTKLRETVSVKDFGAVGNGVANDSVAFQAALDYCKANLFALNVPAGTYLLNTGITVTSFAGLQIIGDGINITKFRKTTAGNMFTLTNCSRSTISGIAFDGTGMSSGNGIVIDGTTSGVITIRDNQFAYFPDSGVFIDGLAATPFSSFTIENNLFLTNGITNTEPQLKANYCNDSTWIGNQFGNDGSANYAPYGVYMLQCSAGDYANNYHWNNLVGGYYEQNNYVRFAQNRWETNQRQGIQVIDSALCSFIGNHIHTNSEASTGTYNGMEMENCGQWTFVGNLFYSFNLILTNYNLSLDTACSSILIDSNFFSDYTTDPIDFDPTSFELKFKNNLPRQLGLDEIVGTWIAFNSKAGIASGTTVYMGASGGNSATIFDAQSPMPLPCVATRLRVISSAAPSAGQSYTFTLMIGNTPTSLVATISGTAQNAEATGLVPLAFADLVSIRVVTSAGAATANFTGTLVIEN